MSSTRANTRRIYNLMRNSQRLTRREIAERLGIQNGEASARIKELLDGGKLRERGYKLSPITKKAVGLIEIVRK